MIRMSAILNAARPKSRMITMVRAIFASDERTLYDISTSGMV